MKGADLLLNGRRTGPLGLVISPIGAKSASNFWSSSEYNETNAWNVNFSSGNVNNNNKYNSNVARAVVALSGQVMEGWVEAFEDCCLHKMTTEQCVLYRLHVVEDLPQLAAEIVVLKTYEPGVSVCFIVTRPKLREIFAAMFRDRIAQHWVCLRLRPFFEERFRQMENVSYNCRVGFGTAAAADRAEEEIRRVSQNYTVQAYIGTMDIWSFFMTIDKLVLWSFLEPFIRRNADRIRELHPDTDIETLIWLARKIVMHAPQHNCERHGRLDLWDDLDFWKSLFNAIEHVGMPIGNITSQELANFLLSFLDEWAVEFCRQRGMRYIRFVDDIFVVSPTKEAILAFRAEVAVRLESIFHQRLHPDKFYIQRYRHGVKFVGRVLKQGRSYTANRTVSGLEIRLHDVEALAGRILRDGINVQLAMELEDLVCGLNSSLGFFIPTASFNVRMRLFRELRSFWKICYIVNAHVVKIRKAYKLKTIILSQYHEENEYYRALFGGDGAQCLPAEDPHHQLRHRSPFRRGRRVRVRKPGDSSGAL